MARLVYVVDLEGNEGDDAADIDNLVEIANVFRSIIQLKAADFVGNLADASVDFMVTRTSANVDFNGSITRVGIDPNA